MNTLKQTYLVLLLLAIGMLPAQASDTAKEKRWASQIIDFLIDGEPQWLEAEGQKFLSIYTPAVTERPKGAVILLHGRGVHPDWPQVIQPLRTALPGKGWASLSLQLPVLSGKAKDQDYVPLFKEAPSRIKAALDFLEQQGIKKIALIGHSLGSNMGTDFLASNSEPRIKAFVGIGMTGKAQPSQYRVLDNVVALLQMKLPVLDIYGSQTTEKILGSVDRRAYVVYHMGNNHSRQIVVQGANHFFQGFEDKLLEHITTWLAEAMSHEGPDKVVVNNRKVQ